MIIICHFSLICICVITSGAARFHKQPTLCMLTSESKISTARCKSCFPPWQNFQTFQILFICTALGIHWYSSTPDYLLKVRLECETKESCVIMDKTYEIWLFWRPAIGGHFCITFKGVLVLLPEEWAKKRENKVELLVHCFFFLFSFNTLSRLNTCSWDKRGLAKVHTLSFG